MRATDCYKKEILLLIFGLFLIFAYSQQKQYRFDHIGKQNGLSSDHTTCIIKDSKGFVWIGTAYGLNRFNGYDFRIYNSSDDTSSLTSDNITILFEDSNGMLWIGTSNGLNLYKRNLDKFQRILLNPDYAIENDQNKINSIIQDRNGLYWIGTEDGLFQFDYNTGRIIQYKQLQQKENNPSDKINAVFEDQKGKLWIGTNGGVFTFDDKSKKITESIINKSLSSTQKHIYCVGQYDNNKLYFGSANGLIIFNTTSKTLSFLNPQSPNSDTNSNTSIEGSAIVSVTKISSELWLASTFGLHAYDIEEEKLLHLYSDPRISHSITTNILNDLFLDNNGILWIVTAKEGINILDTKLNNFHHVMLNQENLGQGYSARTICLTESGELWVGAFKGGMFKFDKEMNLEKHYKPNLHGTWQNEPIISNNVLKIFEDRFEQLWVSIYAIGLTIFDKTTEKFIPVSHYPKLSDSIGAYFHEIYEDRSGRMWFGSSMGLYIKLTRGDEINRTDHETLSKAYIKFIFEDSKSNIWIGTMRDGLFCITPEDKELKDFIHFRNNEHDSNGFHGIILNDFYEDARNNYWLATDEGLNYYDQADMKFIVYEHDKLLYGNQVTDIFDDNKGFVWFLNYKEGLIRFKADAHNVNEFKIFSINDGVPFDNFPYTSGVYRAFDGRIFIGGTQNSSNGFFFFNPNSIKDNEAIPPIYLTNFTVNNKKFQLDSNITTVKQINLNHGENFFSFEFAALNYTNTDQNQYAYYMEGLEDDWIYSGTRRFANYTGLPPGNYIFRVKGSNNDGYWNEKGTYVNISIAPPFWKTWWAYSIYAFALLTTIISLRNYELKRQRLRQSFELEKMEAIKLKELDTMKSRFFANISHEFRTPLTLILGPLDKIKSKIRDAESEIDLSIMQRNALRLQTLINQLLSLSKLESGKMKLKTQEVDIVSVVKGYSKLFESLAEEKQIDLEFSSNEQEFFIYVDKDKLEKILFNILSNAFKFTRNRGKISVLITTEPPSWVQITIADTGQGISADKLEHIFDRFYQADDSCSEDQEGSGIGLALAKELVELHHGRISAESRLNYGTTFIVLLPIGSDHLKPDEIIDTSQEPLSSYCNTPVSELSGGSTQPLTEVIDEQGFEIDDARPLLMIVEDNDDLRTYMRSCLKQAYNLLEVTNGEMGLKRAVENIPDLIISDVMMPGMDGNAMTEKIKSDPRTSHIPVILLTARASVESKIEGLETGADAYLTKPFDTRELKVRIRKMIEQREKLKEHFRRRLESFDQYLVNDPQLPAMDQQFVQKAMEVVRENMAEEGFNAGVFAREMALSRVQLHRKIKALTNQKTTEFIRTIRLNRAASLLKDQTANVSEIAYEVGFGSLSYFTRCFTQQFGRTPSAFTGRNEMNNSEHQS